MAQKVHAPLDSNFLSGSIIITQLPSEGLKFELPVSEMGNIQTLALNFGGLLFSYNCNQALQSKIRSFKWGDILQTNGHKIKNGIGKSVGKLSTTNHWAMEVFLQLSLLFFG